MTPSTKTTADVLREAKALIDTPRKWCKQDYVRHGRLCAYGACQVAACGQPKAWTAEASDAVHMLDVEATKWTMQTGFEFNDSHTHKEVMQLFDRAIARAEESS